MEIWQIDFGNSPMMLLSWISRCTRPSILVRILDKLPEKLFLPNATNVVNRVKTPIGSSPETSFEERSVMVGHRKFKFGKVPENLLLDKSSTLYII